LIIFVFGIVVVFGAIYAFSIIQRHNLSANPVIGQAEAACQEDGVICHVGYEMFSSVESAQDYLNSPRHLEAVKMRELKAMQDQTAAQKSQQSSVTSQKKRPVAKTN
jgi:hypothetical protein